MEKNLTLLTMIIFVVLYIIVWIVITSLFYTIGSMLPSVGINIFIFMVLQIASLLFFLLCIFYSPWNQALQKEIDESKKKYDSIKEDTESTYQNQIKAFWVDALNQQNRYYLFSLIGISFLPFFYFLLYYLSHTSQEIEAYVQSCPLFLLSFTLFYTATITLIYTGANKRWWSILIPALLFFFLGSIFDRQPSLPFMLGYMVICILELFLVLSNVAFYWCLIPLLPFFFLYT